MPILSGYRPPDFEWKQWRFLSVCDELSHSHNGCNPSTVKLEEAPLHDSNDLVTCNPSSESCTTTTPQFVLLSGVATPLERLNHTLARAEEIRCSDWLVDLAGDSSTVSDTDRLRPDRRENVL
jgi:hypothetical protein